VIAVELAKQASRPRPWVTLGVMAAVPALLTAVIGLTEPSLPERVGDFGSVVTASSGFSMPLIALSAAVVFLLPLGVAVFGGEAVAGEAAWGSLRYLLARPVSRSRVFASKAAVAALFSLAAVVAVAASSLVWGLVAFGWRPLTLLDLERTTPFFVSRVTLTPDAALGTLVLATALVACTMASTLAFGLFLSTLTRSPFAAAAGAVGFGLVSRALDNIPGLSALSPVLPMTDGGTNAWTGLFLQELSGDALVRLLLVQAAYTALFLAAAWVRFSRADVLA
jgi:ABC-2 type transport system permease protein